MSFDLASFLDAHSRYEGYRDAAFHLAWEEVSQKQPPGCDLKVMPIDDAALSFWAAVRHFDAVHPMGGFPWDRIYAQMRSTPRRFEVAVWDGPLLCGLAVGKASKGRENVTIRWLERFEVDPNHLKGLVAETVFTAADHYAKILGCRALLLRNPLPGAEPLYRGYGFSLAPRRLGVTYYERPVQ